MNHRHLLFVILLEFIAILYFCNYNVERTDDEQRYSSLSRLEEYNCIIEPKLPKQIICFEEPSTNDSFPELNDLRERELFGPRRNIFFLETSCFGEGGQARLTYRQACCLEAAARTNPNMTVNLFYLSPAPPSDLTKRLTQHLKKYDNLQILRIKLPEYVRQTPIEHWYLSGVLGHSHWPNIHMSDFMRVLTLWKYGGIYLDLDVVALTSLEDLNNFTGRQVDGRPNSAALGLDASGVGFAVASECLRDLMKTYRGNSWDGSSVGNIHRVTQKICNTTDANKMTVDRCGGFHVFPPETFFPVSHLDREPNAFFKSNNGSAKMMKKINAARTVHVWNTSNTKGEKVQKGSPYEQVAKKYCPAIYELGGNEF